MGTVSQAVLALLAAAGLLAAAWLCFGRLLLPTRTGADGGIWTVLPAHGEGARLEQDLRALCWLRDSGVLCTGIVIADAGLSPAGRRRALALMGRWGGIVLCPASRLGPYLTGVAKIDNE